MDNRLLLDLNSPQEGKYVIATAPYGRLVHFDWMVNAAQRFGSRRRTRSDAAAGLVILGRLNMSLPQQGVGEDADYGVNLNTVPKLSVPPSGVVP